MKLRYFILLVLTLILPTIGHAAGPTVAVYLDDKIVSIAATDITYSGNISDIQAMRIKRNNRYYLVSTIWKEKTIWLYIHNQKGKQIVGKKIFTVQGTNAFNTIRLNANTIDGKSVVQIKAVKLNSASQPTWLFKKQFLVRPNKSKPLKLYKQANQAIVYPNDLTALTNEKAGLKLFNYQRLTAGQIPVQRSASIDAGCEKHVEYMRLNGELTHYEETNQPGYTEAGSAAGKNSVLSSQSSNQMADAIDNWMMTLYHRLPLVVYSLDKIGWALSSGVPKQYYTLYYTCLNYTDGKTTATSGDENNTPYYTTTNHKPIPYPGVEQEQVPTTFTGNETPDPISPFDGSYPVGYPITLTFPSNETITNGSMKLKQGSTTVATYFRAPNDPDDPLAIYLGNTMMVIPKSPLNEKTTYTVETSAKRDGKKYSKQWSFTTR